MTSYINPGDTLIIDGKNVIMISRPSLPYGDPRMKDFSIIEDDVIESSSLETVSSPLSRRFDDWAGWEIRDKTLLLTYVGYCVGTAPIVADWYSGLVITESQDQRDACGTKNLIFRFVSGRVQKIVERYHSDRRPAWNYIPGFDEYLDEGDLLGDSDSLGFEELCKGINQLISGTDSAQAIMLLMRAREAIKTTEGLFRSGFIAEAREKLTVDEGFFLVAHRVYSDRRDEAQRIDAGLRHREPYRRKVVIDAMTCIGCGTTIPKKEYERYGGDCIVCHFKSAHL